MVWLAISPNVTKFPSGSFFQDRVPVSTHLPLAWTKTAETEDVEFMQRLSLVEAKVLPN
jgi:dehydrogenase/reductase SDR family protein 12